MGNVCTSSGKNLGTTMTNNLIGQYGETNVLNYAQSSIGNNLVSQQFTNLRNVLTQKFNASPQAKSNPGLLDTILAQINNAEAQ